MSRHQKQRLKARYETLSLAEPRRRIGKCQARLDRLEARVPQAEAHAPTRK